MIRIGSKNNHTTAELKSTWKGLQGKCTLLKTSLMVHRTKQGPTECCWIHWRGEKTERKAHGHSGEGTDYLTYK